MIKDIDSGASIDNIISAMKAGVVDTKAFLHRMFTDELSDARLDKEVNKIDSAKQTVFENLAVIAAFSDFYIQDTSSVTYSTDDEYNINKDLSTAKIEPQHTDTFIRAVSKFYDIESYFPTTTVSNKQLELNIDDRSFIITLTDGSIGDRVIESIKEKSAEILVASENVKKIHHDSHQQTVILKNLYETLTTADVQHNTTSAEFLIENIDVFKDLYKKTTSGDNDKVNEAVAMFADFNRCNKDQSATTAILSSFDLFYNKNQTPEERSVFIKDIQQNHAKEIAKHIGTIDFDEIDKQYNNDVSTILAGIDAQKKGESTKDNVYDITRMQAIKNGKEAAIANPFALLSAQLSSSITDNYQKEENSSDKTKANNVTTLKFRK